MNFIGIDTNELDELDALLKLLEIYNRNNRVRNRNGGIAEIRLAGMDDTHMRLTLRYGGIEATESHYEYSDILCECKVPLTLLRDRDLTLEEKVERIGKWRTIEEEESEIDTSVDDEGVKLVKTVTERWEYPQ